MNLSAKVLPILIFVALLAPQVVVSVFAIVFFLAVIQSLDCMCSQIRDSIVNIVRTRGPLRVPTNFCTMGLFVALACAGAGFVWGINPAESLAVPFQFMLLALSVAAHLLCLAVFLACVAAFNKLVDPSA